MKILTTILLLCMALSHIYCQSLYWRTTTNDNAEHAQRQIMRSTQYDIENDQVQTFALHPLSYYVGGGATFRVGENESFDNQFSVEADLNFNLIRPIKIGRINLNIPFRGALGGLIANQDLNTEFQLGIYPFFQIPESKANYDLIVHGGYEGRIQPNENGFEDSRRLTRVYAGPEVNWYIGDNVKPVVLGVVGIFTNEYRYLDNDGNFLEPGNSFGSELTGIYEIVNGFGLLCRGYLGFSGPRKSSLQFGVVLIGANKGS